ncbi:MAG: hypothetical protein RL083_660, partial [Pseudomonadota bacterium]
LVILGTLLVDWEWEGSASAGKLGRLHREADCSANGGDRETLEQLLASHRYSLGVTWGLLCHLQTTARTLRNQYVSLMTAFL